MCSLRTISKQSTISASPLKLWVSRLGRTASFLSLCVQPYSSCSRSVTRSYRQSSLDYLVSKNRASPEIVRDSLAFSPATPRERMSVIEAGWEQLQYKNSAFLMGAGISVTQLPITVHGRNLPNPDISFGKSNKVSLQVRHFYALFTIN